MAFTLEFGKLLDVVGPCAVEGAGVTSLSGIASLAEAGPGDLSFLGNDKYREQVPQTRAGVVLLPPGYQGSPARGQVFIRVEKPSYALALVCGVIERMLWPGARPGVHASAVVADGVVIPADASVGPLAVVESGAVIGAGCVLAARAHVGRHAILGADCHVGVGACVGDYCRLGARVRLQPGAVIGSDGFGYETVSGEHLKVPQIGHVLLEDDVEIGANTTIDRARFSVTRVGKGTKVDNLVQIAHNVVIGRHCMIVAQAGIAGSTTLEDYVVIGGQVGLAGHILVGKGVRIGAQAGVMSDVAAGAILLDSPAIPFGLAKRLMVLKHRLPDLFKKVDSLEKQLAEIAASQPQR